MLRNIQDAFSVLLPLNELFSEARAEQAPVTVQEAVAPVMQLNTANTYKNKKTWIVEDLLHLSETHKEMQALTAGNLNLNVNNVAEWSSEWNKVLSDVTSALDAKQYQQAYDLLIALDKLLPVSTWQLDAPVSLGRLATETSYGAGSKYFNYQLNDHFSDYCEALLKCCLALGKTAEAERMFNNIRALKLNEKSYDMNLDKALDALILSRSAKLLNRPEAELALKKEAAKYLLNDNHDSAENDSEEDFFFPAYIITKLWQQGVIKLEGKIYGEPLLEAFELALEQYAETVGADTSALAIPNSEREELKAIFGDSTLEDMHKTVKLAYSQLKFDASQVERRAARKPVRSASCNALLFNPDNTGRLAETTLGSVYQVVKLK